MKIKTFIDQYDWKEKNIPLDKKDWKRPELNNRSIALNMLHVPYNIKKIRPTYISKYNSNRENQVIILMITDEEKQHYYAVKHLSALRRGITSNQVGAFYYLNCLYSFSTENKLKNHKNVCKIMIIAYEMPKENKKNIKI